MIKKRNLALVICLVLVTALVSVGGTLAWLKDSTEPVENTFSVGDIEISLKETTSDYKMVPCAEIIKDPKVTVEANSEACYLFVKIEESENLDTYISYSTADGWIAVEGYNNVFYRMVSEEDAANGVTYSVLSGDKVIVNNVTEAQLEDAETSNPTLTFTAYAVQSENLPNGSDAADAYELAIANS